MIPVLPVAGFLAAEALRRRLAIEDCPCCGELTRFLADLPVDGAAEATARENEAPRRDSATSLRGASPAGRDARRPGGGNVLPLPRRQSWRGPEEIARDEMSRILTIGDACHILWPGGALKRLARLASAPFGSARRWLYEECSPARRADIAAALLLEMDRQDIGRNALRRRLAEWAGRE